jgi:spermidine synthase
VTRVSERHLPWAAAALADPRARAVFENGVGFVASQREAWDVIVLDATEPIGPAVELYLRDFYASAARALRPGGVLVAQSESPFWCAPIVAAIHGELRQAFPRTAAYLASVPTYAGGAWAFAWASADRAPGAPTAAAAAVAPRCRYYTPEVHAAAFVLPGFVHEVVAGKLPFEGFSR